MLFSNVKDYINAMLKIRSIELVVVAICLTMLWLLGDVTPHFIMLIAAITGFNELPAVPYKANQAEVLIKNLTLSRMIFICFEPFLIPIGSAIIFFVSTSFRAEMMQIGLGTYLFTSLLYSVSFCVTDIVVCLVKRRKYKTCFLYVEDTKD